MIYLYSQHDKAKTTCDWLLACMCHFEPPFDFGLLVIYQGAFLMQRMCNSMDYKECYGCHKTIPKSNKGCYCPACRSSISESKKQYSVKAETEKVYKSEQWRLTKEESLKRSHYMCEVCEHMGIVKRADSVHHIIKVADGNNSTHFNLDNLVNVCDEHHRKIEGLNKDELIAYLSSLLS